MTRTRTSSHWWRKINRHRTLQNRNHRYRILQYSDPTVVRGRKNRNYHSCCDDFLFWIVAGTTSLSTVSAVAADNIPIPVWTPLLLVAKECHYCCPGDHQYHHHTIRSHTSSFRDHHWWMPAAAYSTDWTCMCAATAWNGGELWTWCYYYYFDGVTFTSSDLIMFFLVL